MKVIEQIIAYFRSRDRLSASELVYLAEQGFIDYEPPAASDQAGRSGTRSARGRHGPSSTDRLWDEPRPRKSRSKGRHGPVRAKQEPGAGDLCSWLEKQADAWGGELTGLVDVARRLGPCGTWHEAADLLEKADLAAAADAIAGALGQRKLATARLWSALRFDGYRRSLPSLSRRVGNAYDALLPGRDIAEIAQHAWLLRHDPIARVYRLVRAQRRLMAGTGIAHRRDPASLWRAVPRHGPVVRWLLVQGIADCLARQPGAETAGDDALAFLLPTGADWSDAWAVALLTDPPRVAPLLSACREMPLVFARPVLVAPHLRRFALPSALAASIRAAWDGAQGPIVRPDPEESVGEPPLDEETISALGRLLAECPHWTVRRAVISELARLPNPSNVPLLVAAIDEGSSCEDAVVALGAIGPAAAHAVPALVALLLHATGSLLRSTVRALGDIGPPSAPAVATLIALLEGPDTSIRSIVIAALGKIGPGASATVPSLREVLRGSPDAWHRELAADALEKITGNVAR